MVLDTATIRKHLTKIPPEKLELLAMTIFVLKRRKNDPLAIYRDKYYYKPLDWVDAFVEIKMPPYMRKTLGLIQDGCRKIAYRGPHGIGKTVLAALIVLWAGSVSNDCKIPTTAGSWRQLTKFLWPEIHKWETRTNWKKIGMQPEILRREAKFSPTSEAFGVACTNPATIEGAHAQRIVYVYDESKAIPPATWEASEGAFSTIGDHLQVALSTPGEASGVFYSICSRQKGYEEWTNVYVSPRDAIRAGRMSLEWAKNCRQKWGAQNPVYKNRVWGLFAEQATDSVIPLSWIEAAIQRWHMWYDDMSENGHIGDDEKNKNTPGKKVLGVDVSRGGADRTAMAYRKGKILTHFDYYHADETRDTMVTVGRTHIAMGDGIARVDVIGIGAGVVDRLREVVEDENKVVAVNAGAGCENTDRSGELNFVNIRSAMWWCMRELLDPQYNEEIALPDDPELIGDLCTPKYKPTSNGKILIESKVDIKKRIGRSTDSGDACIHAFFDGIESNIDYIYVG